MRLISERFNVCVAADFITRLDEVQQVFIHMGDFPSRLREERKRLGLSQEELATLGGVKLNAQSNYETGKRAPDADYLTRVAAHGVDVGFLFSGLRAPAAVEIGPPSEQPTATGDMVLRAVTPEQAALLDNYQAADERGRAAARSVLDALAQPKRANG